MQHTFAGHGVDAGTTATVVLQVGWLITCANVGDSLGYIDTGAEVRALAAAGGRVRAGVGSDVAVWGRGA